jgi:DNA invertase Pin-like site-specific DNA recombinase
MIGATMPAPADPHAIRGSPSLSLGGASDAASERLGAPLRPRDAVIGYVAAWPPPPDGKDEAAAAIAAAVERRNLRLLEIVRERDTGVPSLERPGVAYALARIAAGEARALVISDLRTLCRSIVDLGSLVHRLTRARAALIALDLDIDTTTSDGRAGAEAVMTLAGWEHDRIARRTRTGIDRARARGRPIGPPAVSDAPAVRERVAAMRAANMTLQAIADTLNAEGVPTMRGGARWRPSSVQTVLGYRRPTRSR